MMSEQIYILEEIRKLANAVEKFSVLDVPNQDIIQNIKEELYNIGEELINITDFQSIVVIMVYDSNEEINKILITSHYLEYTFNVGSDIIEKLEDYSFINHIPLSMFLMSYFKNVTINDNDTLELYKCMLQTIILLISSIDEEPSETLLSKQTLKSLVKRTEFFESCKKTPNSLNLIYEDSRYIWEKCIIEKKQLNKKSALNLSGYGIMMVILLLYVLSSSTLEMMSIVIIISAMAISSIYLIVNLIIDSSKMKICKKILDEIYYQAQFLRCISIN